MNKSGPPNSPVLTAQLPLVSIVTPSFNQGSYLEQTILSVLQQDYPRIEYIVVDGKSSDNSVNILQRYKGQIDKCIIEPDHGQTDAINKGFRLATGEIFAWLNSDDILLPSAVSCAVRSFIKESRVGVVYGDRVQLDSKGNITGLVTGPRFYGAMFRHNITIPQEATFFRRSVFEQVEGLRADLSFALDFDLWIRMSKITEFRHVPAFLGGYRAHHESKSVLAASVRGAAAGRSFREESERVYREHFGKPLPTPRRQRLWRLLWKARLFAEKLTGEHRSELAEVRESQRAEWGVQSGNI